MPTYLKSLRLTSKLVVLIALATALVGIATWFYVAQVSAALTAVHAEQTGIAPALAAFDARTDASNPEARKAWRDGIATIADSSTLSLDPEADTYHLMSAAMFSTPALLAALGDAGTLAANAGPVEIAVLRERITSAREAMAASTLKSFAANPEIEAELRPAFEEIEQSAAAVAAGLAAGAGAFAPSRSASVALDHGTTFGKAALRRIDTALGARGQALAATRLRMVALVSLGLLAFAGLGIWIVRGVNAEQALERERADREHDRAEQIKAEAEINRRIRNALDNVSTNVMIADSSRRIVYVNRAVQAMLQAAESDIRRDLPAFEAAKLVGTSIDSLHRNPTHQMQMLDRMTTTMKAAIKVGGHDFGLAVSPVTDEHGARIGFVVEWLDRTVELATEAEVSRVVEAAGRGDFTQRISMDGKTGYFGSLAKSINDLLETSSVGLGEVVRVLGALAKGDLTESISNEYHGTFGQLKADSNSTVHQLSEIVTTIKSATDTINVAASEIASGNQDLSSRTEQQAASLQETAASMEQLTSTVKQNAESARRANELAIGASEVALQGGKVVSNVVTTMEAINDSSKKIVDIISVIDGIAFQTNILALNAAVEAARAGEQGRGFAVVASEVRSLAQRSATAAKEIKGLIGDSVEKVGNGTRLVQQAGQTMGEIVTSVKRVTDIMGEITAASEEQSSGIEQINLAITQMDEVTQQNAALVEEATAAARSMEQQAHHLARTVSVFVLGSGGPESTAVDTAAVDAVTVRSPVSRPPRSVPVARGKMVARRAAGETKPGSRKVAATGSGADVWTEF